MDEVVLCLEQELRKPLHEKKLATGDLIHSGSMTPNVGAFPSGGGGGDLSEDGAEMLSDADPESFTLDSLGRPAGSQSILSSGDSTMVVAESSTSSGAGSTKHTTSSANDPSLEESAGENLVERVINIKECPLCHRSRLNSRLELG